MRLLTDIYDRIVDALVILAILSVVLMVATTKWTLAVAAIVKFFSL